LVGVRDSSGESKLFFAMPAIGASLVLTRSTAEPHLVEIDLGFPSSQPATNGYPVIARAHQLAQARLCAAALEVPRHRPPADLSETTPPAKASIAGPEMEYLATTGPRHRLDVDKPPSAGL